MPKGALRCKGFFGPCFWLLWNVTHCYRGCLRPLGLQVYHILQAHKLFPWGPRCILDLPGVLWPASTIQFPASWHPVLENDLPSSLSVTESLLKKCCCSGRPTGVPGKRKQCWSRGSSSEAHTHTGSHLRKSSAVCVPVFEMIKEYRKIPNMYSMKQVQRSPATRNGQCVKLHFHNTACICIS